MRPDGLAMWGRSLIRSRASRGAIEAVRRHLAEPLHRTTWGLMASTLVTSVLGVAFWALAARLYEPAVVGRDGALIASIGTVSAICQLNLGNVIVRFLPQVRERVGRRVVEAYALAGFASLLGSLLFIFVAPAVSGEFDFLQEDTLLAVTYVVGVAAWTIFVLQDAVLTALSRASWLPLENGTFSALKIAALPAGLMLATGHGVVLAWVIPALVTVPVMNWLIARRVIPQARQVQRQAPGVVDLFGRRRLVAFLAQDFGGTALAQLAMTAVPLMTVALVGAAENAYFYVPFALVTTFDLMFFGATTSLTTVGARSPERARELTGLLMRRLLTIQVPVAALLVLVAPLLLIPFGPDYVEHGTAPLRLLLAASCCRAVLFLFIAVARLQGNGGRLLLVQAAMTGMLIPLVLLLAPTEGLSGVGLAWLITHAVLALAVVPSLVSFLKDSDAP
jgi:O-antigen/teichoic acid export membrane protein